MTLFIGTDLVLGGFTISFLLFRTFGRECIGSCRKCTYQITIHIYNGSTTFLDDHALQTLNLIEFTFSNPACYLSGLNIPHGTSTSHINSVNCLLVTTVTSTLSLLFCTELGTFSRALCLLGVINKPLVFSGLTTDRFLLLALNITIQGSTGNSISHCAHAIGKPTFLSRLFRFLRHRAHRCSTFHTELLSRF